MDISSVILDLLKNLDTTLTCPVCNKKCEEPVRIKTCGHYFCETCLNSSKIAHNCSKCDAIYDAKELDFRNFARECHGDLVKLRSILENTYQPTASDALNPQSPKNTVLYAHNEYHINFITMSGKINRKGETPLHLACKRCKLEEVKKLIDEKVDINAKDYAGWAPLHEAVQSKSLEIVDYLLKNRCLVNIPGLDFETPLHKAASLDLCDMVKLLLHYGADKDIVDYTGQKPIDSTTSEQIKTILNTHLKSPTVLTFEVYLPSNISLYCHTIDDSYKEKLKKCKNITVVEKLESNKNLTHFVIKKTHKMSFKILQAMLEGLQFLTQDSVDDYIVGNYFLNIPSYEFLSKHPVLNEGIKKSMISALLKHPKLFKGINFYIEDHSSPIEIYNLKVDKEYLSKLIKAGEGTLLHRPPATRTCESKFLHSFFASTQSDVYRCCNFIIYAENNIPELMYNMNELKHKSSRWLIDCIAKFEITD